MKHCALFRAVTSILVLTVLLAFPLLAKEKYVPGEVLVKLKTNKEAAFKASLKANKMSTKKVIKDIGFRVVKLPPGLSVEQAVEKLKKDPSVEYVGPNHTIHIEDIPQRWPNDTIFWEGYDILDLGIFIAPPQWGLYNDGVNQDMYGDVFPGKLRADIHAPEAWAITIGSPSLIIASVDTGVDYTHADLAAKVILPGYNAIDHSSNVMDDNGHGTYTAAIAAADTDNVEGIAGVAWECPILPVKVIRADGSGDEADGADGVVWAVDHGAKVLNMSFATDLNVPALEAAVNYAYQHNCIPVCASGNENVGTPMYPAAYEHALAVGATNPYDKRCTAADWGAGGSNYGPYLDVAAPGNQITSAYSDPDLGQLYFANDGTSAAAPFVSGVAALLWSQYPTWTNQQVMDQIMHTADDCETGGWDQYTGWGRVNAYRALTETSGPTSYIGQLKDKPDGFYVEMTNKVITAGTGQIQNMAYIEESDRSNGMMVSYPSGVPSGFFPGDRVNVTGSLGTINGQRVLVGTTLTKVASGAALKPLGVTNKRTAQAATGLPCGLLVKVWGRVTLVGWDNIYIDDGSGLYDGLAPSGLRIPIPSPQSTWEGKIVSVVGECGMDQPSGASAPVPVVRPRIPSDVRVLN